MAGVIILDGDVRARNEIFRAIDTISGVDTSGSTLNLDVKTESGKLTRLLVRKTLGPLSGFTVQLYDNSTQASEYLLHECVENDDVITRINLAFSSPLIFSNSSAENNLYVKIIPLIGTGHSFQVRADGEKTVV